MPLVEDLEKRGAWFFRWRSFLPLVLIPFAFAVAFFDDNTPDFTDPRWIALCASISFLGQIIRALTIGYVPKGTSGRNTSEGQVALTLNTQGMYGYVRHPLYLGNYFMWLGIVLFTGSWEFAVCVTVAFWIYYTLISMTEERYLRGQFGDVYIKWSEGIPAFFPRSVKWLSPGVFFSLRNVLKREYNGAYAMIVSFIALDGVHNFREGVIGLSEHMQYALSAASVCFLVLRMLKKRTSLLDVEGREYTN
jgi:protein-S-isoprenylcysteine O-methyltransferase Ste14